jgi:hypothetical protein
MAVGINSIRELICKGGGVSFSNAFKVTFEEDQRGGESGSNAVFGKLKDALGTGFSQRELVGDSVDGGPARWISMMCEEVTLPGSQFATGQVNGIHTGSGQFNYPHTRLFNDITLTWICDANMTPLKFVNTWMDAIFDDGYKTIIQTDPNQVQKRERNRTVRLNYPDEYTMCMSVLKAEKNDKSEIGRASIRYFLEGVYPYSVDSVPLSMGTSQLVKVSANFYYERWYEYYVDQWGKTS